MENIIEIAKSFLIALVIVGVGWTIAPILRKKILKASKNATDQGMLTFVASSTNLFIKFLSIVIALSTLGVNMSIIVGAFSALGLGISLALKDNMADVAGGIQILFTKPFKVNDYIKVDTYEGYVIRIEMMYVVLKTFSAQEIIIPNSDIVKSTVTNYSRDAKRRITVEVPVGFDTNIEECLQVFKQTIQSCSLILQEEPQRIAIERFQTDAVVISIYCWCEIDEYWNALYQVTEKVQKARVENNISYPYTKIISSK